MVQEDDNLLLVEPCFISAGCNKTTNVSVYSESDGYLYYGANNMVAIARPFSNNVGGGVSQTLFVPGLVCDVTCISISACSNVILTGFADGSIVCWVKKGRNGDWTLLKHLKPHGSAISCLSMIIERDTLFSVSASDDGLCHIYKIAFGCDEKDDEISTVCTLSLGKNFATSCCLFPIPPTKGGVMLALGQTDCKVHLYHFNSRDAVMEDSNGFEVEHLGTLDGHENWIRSIDYRYLDGDEMGYLATAAQDYFIRIWKIDFLLRGSCHDEGDDEGDDDDDTDAQPKTSIE